MARYLSQYCPSNFVAANVPVNIVPVICRGKCPNKLFAPANAAAKMNHRDNCCGNSLCLGNCRDIFLNTLGTLWSGNNWAENLF